MEAGAPTDQGDIRALAEGEAAVEWQALAVVDDRLRVHPVEPGGFEKDHRVRVVDGGE
ncbi:hypothetical protein D3C81_2105440 [compost metagenome]